MQNIIKNRIIIRILIKMKMIRMKIAKISKITKTIKTITKMEIIVQYIKILE